MLRGTPAPGRTTHRDKHHWVPFFQEHTDCFSMGSSVLTGTGGPTLMAVVMRPFLHLWQNNMLAPLCVSWVESGPVGPFSGLLGRSQTSPPLSTSLVPLPLLGCSVTCSVTNLSIHSANSHIHSFIHSFTPHSLTCSITYPLNSPLNLLVHS